MIRKFSVENFKNFKDKVVFDFTAVRDYDFNRDLIKNGLLNKVIIFGYNDAGKSNLGFAMMDITTHLTDNARTDIHYQLPINLESGKAVSTFTYEFSFSGHIVRYVYQKNADRRLLSEEVFVGDRSVFYYDYERSTYRNDLTDIKSINLANRTENVSALKFIRNNCFTFKEDDPIKAIVDFANEMLWFRSLRFNEFMGKLPNGDDIDKYILRYDLLSDFMAFLHDCGVSYDLVPLKTPLGVTIGVRKGKVAVPFFDICSTGTACLSLFYYWQNSCFNRIKFLFLDEFDAFYHEDLSAHLLKILFRKNEFQCVLTTHNASLATNQLTRPDAVMILKNDRLRPLCDLTKKILREGHNLRKLMEAGEFDG